MEGGRERCGERGNWVWDVVHERRIKRYVLRLSSDENTAMSRHTGQDNHRVLGFSVTSRVTSTQPAYVVT